MKLCIFGIVLEYPFAMKKNVAHINAVIKWWNDSSKFPHEHCMEPEFQRTLDDLLDIAEKPKGRYTLEKGLEYLRCVMKKRACWIRLPCFK